MTKHQVIALEAKIALSRQLDALRAEANAITKQQQKIAMYTGVSDPRMLRRIEAEMHERYGEDLDGMVDKAFCNVANNCYDLISNKVW